MMRHPFEGVILPDPNALCTTDQHTASVEPHGAAMESAPASRRTFFARTFAAALGAFALWRSNSAEAQERVRQGGFDSFPDRGSGRAARIPPPAQHFRNDQNQVTTQALGEEGGRGDDQYTTQALGEEGSGYPGGWRPAPPYDDRYTTYALGEEGAWGTYPPRFHNPPSRRWPPYHRQPRGRYTTQALGEEGGWWW